MSGSTAMLFAALGLAAVAVIGVLYAILKIRRATAEQEKQLSRISASTQAFPQLLQEFRELLGHVEADSRELQRIVLQIESSIASLNHDVTTAAAGAAERQTAAIESLRDYFDAQEQRLATVVETLSEGLRALPRPAQIAAGERNESAGNSRYRREALSGSPELRFSVLKEWLSINALAILHRAAGAWKTADDLIATVPPYLQPEAEILDGAILLVGTRDHPDRLAIAFRELDSTSPYRQWFGPPSRGQATPYLPAVLIRSNGHFKLLAKGTDTLIGSVQKTNSP